MKRALLLACGSYRDAAFAPLAFPLSDVDQVEDVLRDRELCEFDEVTVIRDPTKAQAHRAMEQLTTQSEQDDFILLYYSGHGKLSRSGSVVLVFADTESAFLHSSGVLDDDLRTLFNQARARQKAIILDCCHSGAAGDEGFKRAAEDGLEALAQRVEGTFVLSASTKFQPAFERPELQGSALTTCLVEGVRSGAAAAPGAKVVTLSQLGEYVAREVPRRSPQQPKFWDHGGVGAAAFSKVSRRLDRAWADNATRELRKRFARDQVDEETFDEVRAALRGDLGPAAAPALALIDDLVERRLAPMTFARRWLALQRSGANAPPPAAPEADEAGPAPEAAPEPAADEAPGLAETIGEPGEALAARSDPIDETDFHHRDPRATPAGGGGPEGADPDGAPADPAPAPAGGGRQFASLFVLSFLVTSLAIVLAQVLGFGGFYVPEEMVLAMLAIGLPKALIDAIAVSFVMRRFARSGAPGRLAVAAALSPLMAVVFAFLLSTTWYLSLTLAAFLGLTSGVTYLIATQQRGGPAG